MYDHQPNQKPPEGVIRGENVHPESEPDEISETIIERTVQSLKLRGAPYSEMDEDTLRERAVRLVNLRAR